MAVEMSLMYICIAPLQSFMYTYKEKLYTCAVVTFWHELSPLIFFFTPIIVDFELLMKHL